ncbi:glutamate-1-semialdehyde 2,1-aminomutase [Anaerovibrio lipolyticus DSM 3074]|uniref:Glutamate-1-semialdehyde 2,1-aminomutase n=1 Tax=Anaerovibrio lipolyticus DSM 3074 TaxID=1120997 RepID=A0A1M6FDK5_9FIRM|nr:aminotransferase class III-fold pyridoxal phosphate-dependent enzyme [Anaerovibrio lipolyticus]SHI95824.1 glutamate-1-semialdehyde 2,1-aminomutase [Anaerovibrio lipolyticus DSM 3074]
MSISKDGKGQILYRKAKRIIPGGTQLLSKRPEMFLPELWPAYYSRAKGCKIWDLDGNEYIDVSYMGIGSNVLGYANDEVDAAAKEAINSGGMCTLNAPEEVYLAEKLIDLHPWAGGVRYAKAGGEAMALASRIARAHTNKDIILFCGYHGWHDWYLSANLANKNALDDLHIPGLEPLGVPKGLAGTNLPFHYNNIDEFYALMDKHKDNIAAVVIEPIRNDYPEDDFLKKIRTSTEKSGVVLIFDEVSAGFRLCAGGSHRVLGVDPDIAVFAKGMTNGYPLTAVVGKSDVMDAAQETFISSTFYTERVAFAATLKSIEVYERERVWEKQSEYGKIIQKGWKDLANTAGLKIDVGGILPMSHFSIIGNENPLIYKTFVTQEMLKRGYIASNSFYTSNAHSAEIINQYLKHLGDVFKRIAELNGSGITVESQLEYGVCQSGFGRLN